MKKYIIAILTLLILLSFVAYQHKNIEPKIQIDETNFRTEKNDLENMEFEPPEIKTPQVAVPLYSEKIDNATFINYIVGGDTSLTSIKKFAPSNSSCSQAYISGLVNNTWALSSQL